MANDWLQSSFFTAKDPAQARAAAETFALHYSSAVIEHNGIFRVDDDAQHGHNSYGMDAALSQHPTVACYGTSYELQNDFLYAYVAGPQIFHSVALLDHDGRRHTKSEFARLIGMLGAPKWFVRDTTEFAWTIYRSNLWPPSSGTPTERALLLLDHLRDAFWWPFWLRNLFAALRRPADTSEGLGEHTHLIRLLRTGVMRFEAYPPATQTPLPRHPGDCYEEDLVAFVRTWSLDARSIAAVIGACIYRAWIRPVFLALPRAVHRFALRAGGYPL